MTTLGITTKRPRSHCQQHMCAALLLCRWGFDQVPMRQWRATALRLKAALPTSEATAYRLMADYRSIPKGRVA